MTTSGTGSDTGTGTVAAKGDARALVELIARSLAEKPDEVKVEAVVEGSQTALELTVAESDMGRIIGRGGRTARVFRQMLAAVSTVTGVHYELEILE